MFPMLKILIFIFVVLPIAVLIIAGLGRLLVVFLEQDDFKESFWAFVGVCVFFVFLFYITR